MAYLFEKFYRNLVISRCSPANREVQEIGGQPRFAQANSVDKKVTRARGLTVLVPSSGAGVFGHTVHLRELPQDAGSKPGPESLVEYALTTQGAPRLKDKAYPREIRRPYKAKAIVRAFEHWLPC